MVGSCSCAPVWAGGVGLDAGGHQLELAAEILHCALWLRRRCVGIEKAVLALERIACTFVAVARQCCCDEAGECRPANLEALCPGTICKELQATCAWLSTMPNADAIALASSPKTRAAAAAAPKAPQVAVG